MQTPLMELIEWIENENLLMPFGGRWNPSDDIKKKATELLEKEREVIIKANRDGVDMVIDETPFITGSDYFTKTFTNESK